MGAGERTQGVQGCRRAYTRCLVAAAPPSSNSSSCCRLLQGWWSLGFALRAAPCPCSGPEGEVAAGDGTYSTSIPLWKASGPGLGSAGQALGTSSACLASLRRRRRPAPRTRATLRPHPRQGLDPLSEVVLAYHHNGRLLQPDHGYPLRAVVPGAWAARAAGQLQHALGGAGAGVAGASPPTFRLAGCCARHAACLAPHLHCTLLPALRSAGYIGGRCVKWLTRIELSRGGRCWGGARLPS